MYVCSLVLFWFVGGRFSVFQFLVVGWHFKIVGVVTILAHAIVVKLLYMYLTLFSSIVVTLNDKTTTGD